MPWGRHARTPWSGGRIFDERSRELAIVPIAGMACTAPAVPLLWKAAAPTEQDELDRALVEPMLPDAERRWLDGAIARAHPASPWRGA